MDHSPFKLNARLCKNAKSFITARKSISKLVNFPSLVAKYCKKRKIYVCKVCNFFITHGKAFRHFVVRLFHRKYKDIQNLQTSQAYIIFRVLQYFATKLGNFTNFKMLFLAVVKDFALFAKMKIQFKRGIVHYALHVLNPGSFKALTIWEVLAENHYCEGGVKDSIISYTIFLKVFSLSFF